MALKIIDHSLIRHKLNLVRKRHTPPEKLRSLLEEITLMSIPFVLEGFPLRMESVETPMGVGRSFEFVEEDRIVFICILRAGLPMLNGALRALPGAKAGFLAIKRNEDTLTPELYYRRLPPLEGRFVILLDPMLATGGTLSLALSEAKSLKPEKMVTLNLVASPQGLERTMSAHPDVDFFLLSVDEGLSPKGYIVPGVGDIGDRLFTEGL
ncbi:MAG: uracil phosphoribosyltransferase [Aquificaceae bacterium]|jgi:uracil phosphoribosyltransferase|uniref:uracil phosphoribosyltransferase n=1 Tax=Hydrogenobacter sp. Uz 6-8 TaxID=3384828 RepID=UPI000F1DDD7B|nr:MAG: uracil phosphoribosyltransferase [Aquificota bacterium]